MQYNGSAETGTLWSELRSEPRWQLVGYAPFAAPTSLFLPGTPIKRENGRCRRLNDAPVSCDDG